MSMDTTILCPRCGSKHTEYIPSDIPRGKASGYRIDLEMHPYLYRCLDCGEVFPGDGFPLPDLPEEV